MTPHLTLPPLLDDQGTGWLLLALAVLLVAATLWRGLRRAPPGRTRTTRPGAGTRRPGRRPPRPGEIWWGDVLRVDRRVALEAAAFRRFAGPCPPQAWSSATSRR